VIARWFNRNLGLALVRSTCGIGLAAVVGIAHNFAALLVAVSAMALTLREKARALASKTEPA
jgi:hypothetical protein